MCRMVCVRMKNGKPSKEAYLIVREALLEFGRTQRDGTGLSGLTKQNTLYYFKSDATAGEYFSRKDWAKSRSMFHHSPVMLGHVRLACSGGVCPANAHPFRGEYDGMQVDLIHNGWLNNEDKLVAWLKESGHAPKTKVDSELIARTLELVGFDNVPAKLIEMGVTGKANFMALFEDGTLQIYSHGDIEIYEDDEKVVVATESFKFPGETYYRLSQWHKVVSGTVITITPKCKVITKTVENLDRMAHVRCDWSGTGKTVFRWDGGETFTSVVNNDFYERPYPFGGMGEQIPTVTPDGLIYLPEVDLWSDGHTLYDEGNMVVCDLKEYPEALAEYRKTVRQDSKIEDDCDHFDELMDRMDRLVQPEIETLVSKNFVEIFKDDMRHLSDDVEVPLFPKGRNTKQNHKEMILKTYKITPTVYELLWERFGYLRPVEKSSRDKALEFIHKLNPPSKYKGKR